MAEMKTAAELVGEVRDELAAKHTGDLVAQQRHLCLCGIGDILLLTGAIGLGVLAGMASANLLQGRWRVTPLVAGAGLVLGARMLNPDRHRFAQKAALAVGGMTMIGSNVIFTFTNRIAQEEAVV
jgi:hypothetical protein